MFYPIQYYSITYITRIWNDMYALRISQSPDVAVLQTQSETLISDQRKQTHCDYRVMIH